MLSICCIVKNESAFLPRLFENIRSLADEIIIVDTGSEDGSDLIAESMGAKVFSFTWNNDFAEVRNFAKSKASGKWILMLDADEILPQHTIDILPNLMKDSKNVAFTFSIVTEVEHFATAPLLAHPSIRLFKNLPYIQYQGHVHETILASVKKKGAEIGKADAEILHYGYIQQFASRVERNTTLFEMAAIHDPGDIWLRLQVGLAFYVQKNYKKSREYLQRILSSQYSEFNANTRSSIMALVADTFYQEGNNSQTRAVALQAISLGGNLFAEFLMVSVLLKEENYALAMKRLLTIHSNAEFSKNVRVHLGAILGSIARCCLKMNDPKRALEFAELALKDPSFEAMMIGGFISELLRDYKKALQFYTAALELDPESEQARFKVAVCRATLSEAKS